MEIDKKYHIDKCVSSDPNRENLVNIWVTTHHAFATDGHILAAVPVKQEKGDTEGWMTPDTLKLARKGSKGTDTITISLNGQQILPGGVSLSRPEGGTFPHLKDIFRRVLSNRRHRIGINAAYLKDLSDALGTDRLILEFDGTQGAILVRPVDKTSKALGLIMPISTSS